MSNPTDVELQQCIGALRREILEKHQEMEERLKDQERILLEAMAKLIHEKEHGTRQSVAAVQQKHKIQQTVLDQATHIAKPRTSIDTISSFRMDGRQCSTT